MSEGGVMIMKDKINAFAIGERLKRLRGDRTLKEVSERVGISESALSMYENGARIPRDEIKIKLANYYKKTIQSIFFT
ncbi:DNA-binding helix-turn-helix protein [Solobacterium moorei F0204]|uniref:DNA-binding helix-turn-helix protein n=2 Tax=Solobacterium moorei TaxID=102148 RepID=E7MP23_9FIRM|nr:DNA-binding helix-turn-helix protein [Solobacterium moorei F0204]